MCPNPAWSSFGSVGKVSCQMKTATQTRIRDTVTTGNRDVGLSSFRGITGSRTLVAGPRPTYSYLGARLPGGGISFLTAGSFAERGGGSRCPFEPAATAPPFVQVIGSALL